MVYFDLRNSVGETAHIDVTVLCRGAARASQTTDGSSVPTSTRRPSTDASTPGNLITIVRIILVFGCSQCFGGLIFIPPIISMI